MDDLSTVLNKSKISCNINELTQCSSIGGNKDTPIFTCKIRLETLTYTAPYYLRNLSYTAPSYLRNLSCTANFYLRTFLPKCTLYDLV